MILRDYQSMAVDSIFKYFENNNGHPIISIPTGGGKSIIQAEFVRRTLEQWPSERFLLVSHVKELLVQNNEKIKALLPSAGVGIYSAGLNKKEADKQITIAGIQSVYRKAKELGDISIIIVDECHLLSRDNTSMYRSFFDELSIFCPHVKVIGLSATPFRLDSGPLTKGKNRLFTDICYQISIKELIESGYLVPPTNNPTSTRANVDDVGKRGGEYIQDQLEKKMNVDTLTMAALNEVELACDDRESWLVFCVGVKHADAVNNAILDRGIESRVVVGDTPKYLREEYIDKFKKKEIRCLVSVGVLTTGFDAPNTDAIICLRPTCSPGLWLQMIGRGLRLADNKSDCLVLDFTENTKTHGSIDEITVSEGKVKTAPEKICSFCGAIIIPKSSDTCQECGEKISRPCPKCFAPIPIKEKKCHECGFEPSVPREPNHGTEFSREELLSSGRSVQEKIIGWAFFAHKKEGKPTSLKVEYDVDLLANYSEWICFEHEGYAKSKAASWWIRHNGKMPIPKNTMEAIDRKSELVMPSTITVKKNGKYINVV